jgi:predicted component of type VI protein secretion system
MDKNTIYHKSAKGIEEMSSRTYKLPARERSVLIMVDGKCTAQEVIDKAKHFGEAEHFFSILVAGGFIEPIPGSAPAQAPAPAPAPAAATAAPVPGQAPVERSLASAIDFASHFLTQTIGPDADMMTGKIDGCKTPEELRAVVEKYREMVRSLAGSRRTEEFVNGVSARLP